MKTEKNFMATDRYLFDFYYCSTKKGYAQVDTSQDASYYGIWTNPFKRTVFSYCEGDTCLKTADNDDEYVKELLDIKQWNFENGYVFKGIDPGFNKELKEKFVSLGIIDLLY
jgi:hypothetical protein